MLTGKKLFQGGKGMPLKSEHEKKRLLHDESVQQPLSLEEGN